MNIKDIIIPLDVPTSAHHTYQVNYRDITCGSDRLMLFAGDQKIEHLNEDFYGPGIAEEDADPIHLFNIASKSNIGVFATQLGLIARYGMDFPHVPYLVKVNSKTSMIKVSQTDPVSKILWPVSKVAEFKKNSGLKILGVGYTLYLGSEYESVMMEEAAQVIYEAHQHGMVSVIWCYPRGKAVTDEKSAEVIAGATGTVACLGSDFVKVNTPKKDGMTPAEALQQAVKAAGRTKVVCAGGSSGDAETFLKTLHDQIHIGGTAGNATGRNIHQRPLGEAVRFTNAIYAVTVENKSVEEAMQIYKG